MIYNGLLAENFIHAGKLEPTIAESWTISEDKTRIVFALRDGLKWSDGKPLTADDVVFTFKDVYLNPKIPTPVKDILTVGSSRALPIIKKLDERRIEFTVPEPFVPFLRYVGGQPILPAHVLQKAVQTIDAKRKGIYAQFQQIVQEQLPIIPLVNKLSFEAVRARVQNIKYSAIGGAFWNIYELKVSD